MKRLFDLIFVTILLLILLVPMILVAIAVKMTSKGTVLYWSDRVGQYNRIFMMPKFRTMRLGTPPVATHLMTNHENSPKSAVSNLSPS